MKNADKNNDFEAYKTSVLKELIKEYSRDGFVDNEPILAGFRELHKKVGRSNRKFVSSPEALIARFLRTGQVSSINLLVDIYNLISLKTRLALGAHDIKQIDGNVYLKLTTGEELYIPLGAKVPEAIFPGEYGYIDDKNEVICRMEVLQCDKTKVKISFTDCFYIIQGNKNISVSHLLLAAEELINLVKKYCGGEAEILYFPT